jgi:hypothetical protein
VGVHMASALLIQDRPADAISFLKTQLESHSGIMDMLLFSLAMRTVGAYLYANDGKAAWALIERVWPAFVKSGYARAPQISTIGYAHRARAALLAHAQHGDKQLVRVARDCARTLRRLGRPDASLIANAVSAALAYQRGDIQKARSGLQRGHAECEQIGVHIAALAYQYRLGEITPGPEGSKLRAEAEAALKADSVVVPARWVCLFVPGFIRVSDSL